MLRIVASLYGSGNLVLGQFGHRASVVAVRNVGRVFGLSVADGQLFALANSNLIKINSLERNRFEDSTLEIVCRVPVLAHELALSAAGKIYFTDTEGSSVHSIFKDDAPFWIDSYARDYNDRIHINGLTYAEGEHRGVLVATSLLAPDLDGHWRDSGMCAGGLFLLPSGEKILGSLSYPHSPRSYRGKTYFLESGRQYLSCVDGDRIYTSKIEKSGFFRGLDFIDDFAVIGVSSLRFSPENGLKICSESNRCDDNCGVVLFDIRASSIIDYLDLRKYGSEVFDVRFF